VVLAHFVLLPHIPRLSAPSGSYPFDLCKEASQSTQHYIDLVDSFNEPQRQLLFFAFSI
jgi:hypothetical protein